MGSHLSRVHIKVLVFDNEFILPPLLLIQLNLFHLLDHILARNEHSLKELRIREVILNFANVDELLFFSAWCEF